jgi:hypothetical protein
LLNDDLCFFEAVEYLSVQEFIPEPGVEALAVDVRAKPETTNPILAAHSRGINPQKKRF